MIGDMEEYYKKLDWVLDNSNSYGLFPEAIDALEEDNAWVNPLIWACAEFVSMISLLKVRD